MDTVVVLTLCFVAAEALLSVIQFILRDKRVNTFARICLIILKLLLAIGFGALVMAGPVQLRFVQPFMMGLYVALLADAAAEFILLIVFAIARKERKPLIVKTASLLCGVLLLVGGVKNMHTVTADYYRYTSAELQSTHTVIFLSDLHVGSAQPFEVVKETVAEIKSKQPDAIILGGDIVDDYTTKEEMTATMSLFAGFENPVYFVYGNHDRQGYAEYAGGMKFTPEELEQAMRDNGIRSLKDEFAELGDDVILLGREDLSEPNRRDISTLENPAPEKTLVVVDHQPVKFSENVQNGADLQLSGHTHAGQLFPLGVLYGILGYNQGEYEYEGSYLYVSTGAAGWRMPLRTEAGCHYDVITLAPKSAE